MDLGVGLAAADHYLRRFIRFVSYASERNELKRLQAPVGSVQFRAETLPLQFVVNPKLSFVGIEQSNYLGVSERPAS
jgi:hypothetical protein